VLAAVLLSAGATVGLNLLKGAVRSETDLASLLPPKIQILGTIPPIASKGDERRARIVTLEVAAASLLACAALIVFLLKVRPIL
jgi:polysaccharide biosynthesis transport protein